VSTFVASSVNNHQTAPVIRAVTALVAALMVCFAVPAAAQGADLRTTAEFTEETYVSTDEDVRFTLSVENTGTVSVADVHVTTDLYVDQESLGVLADPGTTLAPGERVSVEVRGLVWQPTDLLRVRVETWAADQQLGEQTIEAPMTMLRGSVSGTVYGDLDDDHVIDPGEGMPGVVVSVGGGLPFFLDDVRAGPGGVFTIPDLPAGHYSAIASVSPLWETTMEYFDVPGGPTTWVIRAVRAVKPALTASATFDRDSYPLDATVREHVVITNTGATDLTGVVAVCDEEKSNMLSANSWGELTPEHGVTLRPGETRTYDFTDVVPPNADRYGFIVLHCWFQVDGANMATETTDRATVPGRTGSVTGEVCQPGTVPCVPVPGLEVLLMDDALHVVARTAAGPDGRFEIPAVPAGRYQIRFVGPWRLAPDADTHYPAMAEQSVHWRLDVVPGPTLDDPDAPRATGTPAAPTVSPAPAPRPRPTELAETGVNVGGLFTLGAALLLSGLVLLNRFRRIR
jgi:hypothetical protein